MSEKRIWNCDGCNKEKECPSQPFAWSQIFGNTPFHLCELCSAWVRLNIKEYRGK